MARYALSYRPPTGFLRDFVVEHSGEHKGRLDLKHGGMLPIVDLARWAGMAAGVTSSSTRERLRAARDAGVLSEDDGRVLEEAFALVVRAAARAPGRAGPRGHAARRLHPPGRLTPLTRSYLKDAFRAVAAVQRRIGAELLYDIA